MFVRLSTEEKQIVAQSCLILGHWFWLSSIKLGKLLFFFAPRTEIILLKHFAKQLLKIMDWVSCLFLIFEGCELIALSASTLESARSLLFVLVVLLYNIDFLASTWEDEISSLERVALLLFTLSGGEAQLYCFIVTCFLNIYPEFNMWICTVVCLFQYKFYRFTGYRLGQF